MPGLLAGVRVVDLSDDVPEDAGHAAARILSDLGADVVLVEPPEGSPARTRPLAFRAWNAGKRSVVAGEESVRALLASADVVVAGRAPRPDEAPQAVWAAVTPFGLTGPRAHWRASDLSIVAAGGNLYPTGDPDRPPLRCSEPTSTAHTAPEVVVAVLTALATGRPQVVDVSMAEAHLMANMGGPARLAHERNRGRRKGAFTGRTRETWRCRDGWVSFGLRGGGARVRNLQTLTTLCVEAGVATSALADRDWTAYDHRSATDDELAAISADVQAYFDLHTMAELYDVAVRTGLMLAPTNSPREIVGSEQLAARGFFAPFPDGVEAPRTFVAAGPDTELVDRRGDAPPLGSSAAEWADEPVARARRDSPWEGVRIIELGSGAAGPLATGYFADHGATVVRVESASRPDFLRTYTVVKGDPEGSAFFAVLNAGKLDITLDLKHPRGREVLLQLVATADVVADNFAPGAMERLGLGRDELRAVNPGVVLVSATLQGRTGPHRDYPGFGGQGAALSGYTFLTGWPDRAPVGPAGTITDSLAPRFAAACVAAALLHRRRTGEGVDLDLSQVEAAAWSLTPWLLHHTTTGAVAERVGNRHRDASPHGVFPCAGDDRWVTVAIWDDEEWDRLAKLAGIADDGLATVEQRLARVDEVEHLVAEWTRGQSAVDVAETLQGEGLEAYPVLDWADALEDSQLIAREHFVRLAHPVLGEHLYERRGFRLATVDAGPHRAAPTLGQHTRDVLREMLGRTDDEIDALDTEGALR